MQHAIDNFKLVLQDQKLRTTLGIAAGFLVIGIVSVVALTLYDADQETPLAQNRQQQEVSYETATKTLNYPDVTFGEYVVNADLPTTENQFRRFTFKTSFGEADAEAQASAFGMSAAEVDVLQDLIVVRDPDSRKIVNFDTRNGTFYYFSMDGDVVSTGETDPLRIAEDYLDQTGLQDGFIGCTHWHRKQEFEEIIFAECHRLWDAQFVGYPILNPYGVMNMPAEYSIADLQLGSVLDSTAPDTDVIATSDNKPGLKRPNQFNTYTVALNGSRVIAVTSTMRQLAQVDIIDPIDIKSPEAAQAELMEDRNTFTFVWPAGEGVIDVDKIYEEASIQADSALVTDVALVYLEEPLDRLQSELVLAYVFKGTAALTNGLDVGFMDVIPAERSDDAVLGASTLFAQTVCEEGKTIQFCTFKFGPDLLPTLTPTPVVFLPTGTPVPTNIPSLTPTPTPSPAPIPQDSCPNYDREIILPNGTKVGYFSNTTSPYRVLGTFHYVPEPANYIRSRDDVPDKYATCRNKWDQYERLGDREKQLEETQKCIAHEVLRVEEGITEGKYIRAMCNPDEASPCAIHREEPQDECYIVSLGSPNLHVYSDEKLSVRLYEPAILTYSYPAADENQSWEVRGGEKVYYEYEKTSLMSAMSKQKFNTGYQVSRENIGELAAKIGSEVGLTEYEKEVFVDEAERETSGLQEDIVNVYVIDRLLLETYLPLSVLPKPESMYRLHLYVELANSSKMLVKPVLEKVVRGENVVVETGVVTR